MTINRHARRLGLFALAFAGLVGLADSASAATWAQRHPRRVEVNHRLHNQNMRIRTERREGEISGAQARALHRQDRMIRHEERVMARHNHGHITRGEQRALNQQENHVSREIGH